MFKNQPIFFIAPDINFALGLANHIPYHIVTVYDHPLIELLQADGIQVLCLEREQIVDCANNSGSILAHPHVQSYIAQHSQGQQPAILAFKPSPKLDQVVAQQGYLLLGNTSSLNRKFEDKILFYQSYQHIPSLQLIPSQILSYEQIKNTIPATPFVIQTARGWAGTSTWIIHQPDQFYSLESQLAHRQVKIAPFIIGATYTVNCCLTEDENLVSTPALQINAPHPEFSPNPAATCGRQWPAIGLNNQHLLQINKIADAVSEELKKDGYKGFFGLDLIKDASNDNIYLLEINPRLTASESFFSQLQWQKGEIPYIVHHINSFIPSRDMRFSTETDHRISGTQLILRNNFSEAITLKNALKPGIYDLASQPIQHLHSTYSVINYPNSFLLRTPGISKPILPHSEILRLEIDTQLANESGKLAQTLIDQVIATKQQLLS